MKYKTVFAFKGLPHLICEMDGTFYYKGRVIHKRYRVGQIYLQIEKKRYGMHTLRKLAYKKQVEIIDLPF